MSSEGRPDREAPPPVDNGYLHSVHNMSTSADHAHSSSTTPTQTPVIPSRPHVVPPSQLSFTPMRSPPPRSPLSRIAAHGSASGSDTNSSATPPANDAAPTTNNSKKKVHIIDGHGDAPPCFIHSGLDKHGSLQDWLRGKTGSGHSVHLRKHHREREREQPAPAGSRRRHGGLHVLTPAHPEQVVAPVLRNATVTESPIKVTPEEPTPRARAGGGVPINVRDSRDRRADGYESSSTVDTRLDSPPDDYDDDDEYDEDPSASLTHQLAATAQGVREVSKELGRTTVHSRIQHVLIVTKARDNGLIRLTRELALYLMLRQQPYIPHSAASSVTDLSRSSERSDRSNGNGRRGIVVYVDSQLRDSKRFDAAGLQREYPQLFEPIARRRSSSTSASSTSLSTMSSSWSAASANGDSRRKDNEGQLRYWTADLCSSAPQLFDFVVTLGGDGTVLFTSWLFQKIVPPVLPFALGSLGFLTNFDFANYRQTMDRVIDDGIRVNLRMRFTCTVYRAVAPDESLIVKRHGKRKAIRRPCGDILVRQVDKDGWDALEGGSSDSAQYTSGKEKEIMCFTTRPTEQFEVLNDLVVDRGPSPYVSLLEVFGDDHHLTTVQADGLTVSTPTGSTAYSLSAGGSLVHPQIPALLLTPICPHTLSFRPMLLPDSMELRVCVPYNSRSTAWASFDGRGRVELKQGDHIKITASKYPFPTVCADKQSTDWFKSISRTLRWNERERQKSFVVVEEDREPSKAKAKASVSWGASVEDDGDSSDEFSEEDVEFDIDDRSGGELTPSPPLNAPVKTQTQSQRLRQLVDSSVSGVQSPDRFASGYQAPPPISQRHLLEKLACVENRLRQASLKDERDYADANADANSDVSPFPDETHDEAQAKRRESEDTVGGDDFDAQTTLNTNSNTRTSRSDSVTIGGRTPRQGRSRSRSRHRGAASRSRSGSPAVKAFAFYGQDDSTSELSDHSF